MSLLQQLSVRYEEPLFRPPSEADSFILQATIGCSWNHCTYCGMYRMKRYRVRSQQELSQELLGTAAESGPEIRRVFVADGDALGMPMELWRWLLPALKRAFPRLLRVSCYATARNLLDKSEQELSELRGLGLSLLYLGPESGDEVTLKAIAKGASFEEHVEAARRARQAGFIQSLMFLIGVGGADRSLEHARASARLASEMDPRHLSLLTVTVVAGTPLASLEQRAGFTLPTLRGLLEEVRCFVAEVRPTKCVFRCNHASNYLPLAGTLPRERERLLGELDAALLGERRLRAEWQRGL
jgi:radical SAM superfamily enzyme YgiQ (UPF0313 family)